MILQAAFVLATFPAWANIEHVSLKEFLNGFLKSKIPAKIGEYYLVSLKFDWEGLGISSIPGRYPDFQLRLSYNLETIGNHESKVEIIISRYLEKDLLAHDVIGTAMASHRGKIVFRVIMEEIIFEADFQKNGYGLLWFNDEGTVAAIMVGTRDDKTLNTIAEAALQLIPSQVNKDEFPVSYDDWCRKELDRRIENLKNADYNKITSQDAAVRKKPLGSFQRSISAFQNLTEPSQETDNAYNDIFNWLKEAFPPKYEYTKNRPEILREKVLKLEQWWKKERDKFTAGSRLPFEPYPFR